MIKKADSKKQIAKLIEKFERLTPSRKNNYNEADTRRDFIMPLFKALGWDVYNDLTENEVVEEETTISGRIDYSFRLNNITQFVLEAKAIPEDLDKEKWAQQAIEYGWNKGIPWVILTDFEGLKIFNSDWKVDRPKPNLTFSYQEYLTRIDDLWFLSRESIQKGELNEQAKKWGITAKRESVNERLAKDLVCWRDILTSDLKDWNEGKYSLEVIEESVQRMLDRLIFIRVVEDRKIEDRILWQEFRKWEKNDYEPQNFIEKLTPLFRKFDEKYNSNLFHEHVCEKLYTTQEPFKQIIPQLYGEKEDGVKYRFDAIDADVLGGVYEQYLGAVQKRKGAVSKRKKQGIYYTPTYIVDYIVQNTLGKLLKETPSLVEREKIKILDPACGSGSFLIKAFETMDENLRKERKHDAIRKYSILTENIYGVDLDEQAVEIARLNLLLKALVPKQKLPLLTEHMKVGNSLISDKKITDKAFDWKNEFPDVFTGKNPGFDVVVGNPPYVVLGKGEKALQYYREKYKSALGGKINLYKLFIERGMNLLKRGGYFGFITPSNYLSSSDSKSLRAFILNNSHIIEIIEYTENDKVFEGVTQALTTLVLKKVEDKEQDVVFHIRTKKHGVTKGCQKDFSKNKKFEFILPNVVIDKVQKFKQRLGDVIEGYQGEINVSTNKEHFIGENKVGHLPLLRGNLISSYQLITKPTEYCPISIEKRGHWKKKRIVFQEVSNQQQDKRIKATIMDSGFLCGHTTNYCFPRNKGINTFFILALLNSNLVNYYFKYYNNTNHVPIGEVKEIPFPSCTSKSDSSIARLSKQICSDYKRLAKYSVNSDKWNKLKNEIEKLDKQINQEVYKLYGLTEEEIGIVEKS
ncbi:N-6 DNA methylase [Patescibacteria group bacterium]|nr:N-6 DNA methylase [Patescibacteria group bacterium]